MLVNEGGLKTTEPQPEPVSNCQQFGTVLQGPYSPRIDLATSSFLCSSVFGKSSNPREVTAACFSSPGGDALL
jgi:hypothetical protein